ncbi:MAG: hypothetical protein H7X80_04495, partial [bacterium]|nr:hypothetical protein [Candidatus Kapabacteria bacterium]
MSVPRLLIISPNPPGDGNVNEILLRDLALLYPAGALACFAVVNTGITVSKGWTLSESLSEMPVEMHNWKHKVVYRRLPAVMVPAVKIAGAVQTRAVQLPAFTKRAIAFAREQNVEGIWAVLNSPVIYPLATSVADALNVPLRSSIWDPAEHMVRSFKLDAASRALALRQFRQTLRRSTAVSVISEGMRDAYRDMCEIEPVILRHGLRDDAVLPPASTMHDPDRLTIGFAGSIYTPEEWATLVRGLERVEWRIAGREVTIR